jgi:hypothetical protein
MTTSTKHRQPERKTTEANVSAPDYGFLLEANQRAFAHWFHGMTVLSQEITQFTQGRLQEDIAAWSMLASCTNPADVLDCQRRFAQRATAVFTEEVAKLSQMMMSLAQEGLESQQRRSDVVS